MKITRLERGWPGHYILSHRCLFRRNTLLSFGKKKIVVSTVGTLLKDGGGIDYIGHERFHETMAFYAYKDGEYWEADVSRQVFFDSDWGIFAKSADDLPKDVDNKANEMHEKVVAEIMKKISLKEIR